MLDKSDTFHGYFPVSDQAMAIGFYLTGAGTERVGRHQPYPLPSHPRMYEFSWQSGRVLPEYQFVYISAGKGEFESRETGPVDIRAGMAMLLIPDVWHRYRPNAATGWTEYWVSFNGALAHFWQKAGLITPVAPLLNIVRKKALKRKLKGIIQAATGNPRDLADTTLFTMEILAEILSGIGRGMDVPRGQDAVAGLEPSGDATVRGALDLVWNYSHQRLAVGDIAKQLRVTRRTLERRFLAACGHTVQDELTACRLSRAQRLLRETHLPIKHIAYSAGFSKPEYMATVFRRKLHTSPRRYRAG